MTILSFLNHREVHLPSLFHSAHIPEKTLLGSRDSSMARSLALKITKYPSPSFRICLAMLEKIQRGVPSRLQSKLLQKLLAMRGPLNCQKNLKHHTGVLSKFDSSSHKGPGFIRSTWGFHQLHRKPCYILITEEPKCVLFKQQCKELSYLQYFQSLIKYVTLPPHFSPRSSQAIKLSHFKLCKAPPRTPDICVGKRVGYHVLLSFFSWII